MDGKYYLYEVDLTGNTIGVWRQVDGVGPDPEAFESLQVAMQEAERLSQLFPSNYYFVSLSEIPLEKLAKAVAVIPN